MYHPELIVQSLSDVILGHFGFDHSLKFFLVTFKPSWSGSGILYILVFQNRIRLLPQVWQPNLVLLHELKLPLSIRSESESVPHLKKLLKNL